MFVCLDHIQAEALCRALKVKTQIANLDGESRIGDPITFAHLGEGDKGDAITLLFRYVYVVPYTCPIFNASCVHRKSWPLRYPS